MRSVTGKFGINVAETPPSALATHVGNMSSGQWLELPTNGLEATINAPTGTGTAGHILAFGAELMWDDTTNKFFFIGGDHDGGAEKFIEYDDATNTWSTNPHPFWMLTSENQNHSYSYMGHDPRGRFWYLQQEYNTATEVWTDHGDGGQHSTSTTRARWAHAYLAGLGNVLYFEGAVYVWDEDTGTTWRELIPRFGLPVAAYPHVVALENHINNLVLFGGGEADDQLWKIDVNENITALGATPLSTIDCNGDFTTYCCAHPLNGNYLFIGPDEVMRELNPVTDQWSVVSGGSISGIRTSGHNDATLGMCDTYGALVLLEWISNSNSKMWVYKV